MGHWSGLTSFRQPDRFRVAQADMELDIMPVGIFDRTLRTPPRTHSLRMLLLQVALVRLLQHRAMKKSNFAHFF
jgi:hypothetical protein